MQNLTVGNIIQTLAGEVHPFKTVKAVPQDHRRWIPFNLGSVRGVPGACPNSDKCRLLQASPLSKPHAC